MTRKRRWTRFLMRWLLDGMTFVVVVVMTAAAGFAISSQRAALKPAPQPGGVAIESLAAVQPALDRLLRTTRRPITLFFADFQCAKCARLWEEVARVHGGAAPAGLVLVLDKARDSDPIVTRIYDSNGAIRGCFGVRTLPTVIVIEDRVVTHIMENMDEIRHRLLTPGA